MAVCGAWLMWAVIDLRPNMSHIFVDLGLTLSYIEFIEDLQQVLREILTKSRDRLCVGR